MYNVTFELAIFSEYLSIVVKNINMPRMKNTIPSPFFVVSLFVARLR